MRPRSAAIPLAALALAVLVALAVAARARVDGPAPPAASSSAIELTVYAAASLRAALQQAAITYEATTPGTSLVVASDSSSALATQIEQGAPADVFLSADATNPRRLVDAGLVIGEPVTFARNQLAIIVPLDDPAGIASASDLARPGVKVIAAGEAVPISGYATELVERLSRQPGAPAGFAASYLANIVSREDDVRAVVAKIALGEGDVAIVYRTDALASDSVATVDLPPDADVTATYDGVVVKASHAPRSARAFLDWLAGPGGRAILADAGFLPPS